MTKPAVTKSFIVHKLDKGYRIESLDHVTKETKEVARSTRRDALNYLFTQLAHSDHWTVEARDNGEVNQ